MKRNLFYTIITIILSFVLILGFQFFTQKDEKNGFSRKIIKQNFEIEKEFQLPSSFFYFASDPKDNNLYFKDLKNLTELFSVNYALVAINKQNLKLSLDDNVKKNQINIGVIDTAIYVTGNNLGKLTIISRKTNKEYSFKNPKIWFDQTKLFSSKSIIGRGIKVVGNTLEMELIKFNYREDETIKTYSLKTDSGGIFSSDGSLRSDPDNKKLFYMYFYKGEFLCLDTNLSMLYKAKTIDTITSTTTRISKLNNNINKIQETTMTQTGPRKLINTGYTVYRDQLYLASALKADNEIAREFRKNQIIDVYSIHHGEYLYSFYIPNYKGKKLQDFRVQDNLIFALYDDYLVKFKLKDK